MRQTIRQLLQTGTASGVWRGTRTGNWSRVTSTTALLFVTAVSACGKGDAPASDAARTPAAGKISANTPTAADTDVAARGVGLPTGYVAQFDQSTTRPTDVSYGAREPGRWEVKTGPAHILYSPHDSAAGKYSVTATFQQLQAPSHPEAFGIILGGSKLDQPQARSYTYFLVRGDGKYLVKVRDGASTRTITDWTANAAIPKQDAAGKAVYGIKVDVNGKTANIRVNGAPVTTVSAANGPLSGITGVRINHNLDLIVTPVSLVR